MTKLIVMISCLQLSSTVMLTMYRQTITTEFWPIVLCLHFNQAQFHIDDQTIKSGYKTTIIDSATAPALWEYIRTKK
jgi:hypothetical protein